MSSDRNELQGHGPAANRRITLLVSAILVVIAIGYEIMSWFLQTSGAISIFAAAIAIHRRPAALNVDKYGLLVPTLLLVWLIAIVVCRTIKVHPGSPERPASALVVLALIVGTIGFNWLFGEAILTEFMAVNGYRRCVAGDHTRWSGKSHAVFINYTLVGQVCRNAVG